MKHFNLLNNFRWFTTILLLLTLNVGQMWGGAATFSGWSYSKGITGGTLSGAPAGATASLTTTYTNANQITSGNSHTLTLSGFDGCTITGLTLSVRSNTSSPYKGAATISITINGSSKGSLSVSRPGMSYGNKSVTVTQTTVNTGTDVIVSVSASENSFYVQSYTITYMIPASDCTEKGASSVTSTAGGNSYGYGPVNNFKNYSTRQILYKRSDLDLVSGQQGTIKSISFYYKHTSRMTKKTSVNIYMANTALSSLSTSNYVAFNKFTLVYSGSLNCTKTNNWNEFILDTPFECNGTDNLVVLIDDNSNAYDGNTYTFYYHSATGSQIYKGDDSTNEDPSTTTWSTYTATNNRPSTKFCIEVVVPCNADPTIGAVSLNGSFNLTTVGVQCASITPGTNCSVASGDYGFIWYERDGTKKEIGGSGVTKVAVTSGAYSSGSFSKNLTKSSFELGTRYSVRAFATNGKPATVYSDTITFQPRSVTFNLNGHGSSTPSVQYVNNGGKATNPSYSESVTGYTFGGWFKEAGCSNEWTFGTDVVSGANKILYAKWTAKTYTIDLDQDLTPTSAGTTSISVTYNANTNLTSAITKPTKTGWTFAGYYTAKNGGGTQIIDADGNVLASKAGYTDASKNWIGTSDVTLYAKWTCTVTWSVNGLTNVYSAHTLTYNGTSTKVASVPGPPSPASYCGDKFVGWTDAAIDGSQDSEPSTLFTTVAGSPELKTVGNTTFHAVFADYDE